MSYSPELNKKIEQYAAGMLEGRELQEFEQLLENDADLKKETFFRKSVVDAIRQVRQHELADYIKSQSKVRLAANPWGKVWTIASVVIIVIAAAVYFIDLKNLLPQKGTSLERPQPVTVPPVVVHNEVPDTLGTVEDTNALAEQEILNVTVAKPEKSNETIQREEALKTAEAERSEAAKAGDTTVSEGETEEIIVKRDELLATLTLTVINKSAVTDTTENLSTSTIEKLNPEAKLPEPAPKQDMFRVELWKSPINFRGYRLVKNRLTLFGVEQTVILRLYRLDDELYLEYGPRQFSKLYPGDQFNAFVRVRDPEILSQLMQ